jgi:NAD(P)-dependent dehydrogenase (short-subunit alcohol dehydrogenase family)
MAGWLEGYAAIVTGGSSGIGAAVVARFVAEGANVVAVDRDGERLAAMVDKFPGRVRGIAGDVRDYATHERAVTEALSSFGKLDVTVGNAGVFDFRRPLASYSAETLVATMDELLAINVRGYLYAAMAAREALLRSRGCIIFTGSVASFNAGGGGIVYTLAKHAVVGVVRQLALELAPDIRVNCVAPGGTLTDMRGTAALGHGTRSLNDRRDELAKRIAEHVPLRLAQQPEDHAGLYVLLASRENARAITGEVLMSDGGVGIRSA